MLQRARRQTRGQQVKLPRGTVTIEPVENVEDAFHLLPMV